MLPAGPLQVIVFGCTRSAGQALALSRQAGHVLPRGVQLVEVPCGGTISSRHLLAAFDAGADGVMCVPAIPTTAGRKSAIRWPAREPSRSGIY